MALVAARSARQVDPLDRSRAVARRPLPFAERPRGAGGAAAAPTAGSTRLAARRTSTASRPGRRVHRRAGAAAASRGGRPAGRRRAVVAPGPGHRPGPRRPLGGGGHRAPPRASRCATRCRSPRRRPRRCGGARRCWCSPPRRWRTTSCGRWPRASYPGVVAGAYDGDTGNEERAWIRRHATAVLTNPEMLHSGILPHHDRWATFLGRLRYVVVDELHAFRGIFGSHVAHLLRRLRRLANHYGADPTFVCCSATIGQPERLAAALCGVPVEAVVDDGSPQGERLVAVWNPPPLDEVTGRPGVAQRRDGAAWWPSWCARARRPSPSAAAGAPPRWWRPTCGGACRRACAAGSTPYRGGYLAEERREIEDELFGGRLDGVVATSALELGIDVGGPRRRGAQRLPGHDRLVLAAGGPGRAVGPAVGRGAGGRVRPARPVDGRPPARAGRPPARAGGRQPRQPLRGRRPPALRRPREAADPRRRALLARPARRGRAAPRPRRPGGGARAGAGGGARRRCTRPAGGRRTASGCGWARAARWRCARPTGDAVGTVELARACEQAHPGASYLHAGQSWRVVELDLDGPAARWSSPTTAPPTPWPAPTSTSG